MARYERGFGPGRDVWEIEVDGCAWTIRYGRANRPLEVYRREYPTPAKAAREAEKLVASREEDGYALVVPEPPRPPPAPPSELELQLRAAPDDEKLLLVHADALQAAGDPRGELITVQLQLPEADAAREVERLVRAHRGALLGGLAGCDPAIVQCRWRHGYLDDVRLGAGRRTPDSTPLHQLAQLLELPDAWFVRTLRLGLPVQRDFGELVEAVIAARPRLPRLRELVVGDFEVPDESELSWVELGDVEGVFALALERVRLQGGSMRLGTIRAPSLRELEIVTGGLTEENAAALAVAELPAIEKLVVWFGDVEYGSFAELEVLAPLLASRAWPRLVHLGLCNAHFTDALCEALPGSPLAAQVEVLELSMGTMSDDGALALARRIDRFPRLRRLVVDESYLTARGVEALEAVVREVSARGQRSGARYPAVGE